MTQEQLKEITLCSPVYHPIYGEGEISSITHNTLSAYFKINSNKILLEFCSHGIIGKDKFLNELYLYPIKITSI